MARKPKLTPEQEFEQERARLREISQKGLFGKTVGYARLSGPGWLQSAITLGGGSLGSSLLLGVVAGYSMMWLQPFAMILGIIMLSAIGYVAMSTQDRPFAQINEHVNPVLGWSWALAAMAANIVWCLPQNGLAWEVLSENLANGWLGGEDSWAAEYATDNFSDSDNWFLVWLREGTNFARFLVVSAILLVSTVITWSYDKGGIGLKIYEIILKLMVAMIVVCFFGVVVSLSMEGIIDWGAIGAGLVPSFDAIWEPAQSFKDGLLGEISNTTANTYWSDLIVAKQQDVMAAAAATAVGINMTFLFPYSLLKKRWGKEHRGLSIFDLSTGMFIPYVLATGCVVIASAASFHNQYNEEAFVEQNGQLVVTDDFKKDFDKPFKESIDARKKAHPDVPVSLDEQKLAASLIKRKTQHLAKSLSGFIGDTWANYVFGFGVLAMALSTISILMLISGFCFTEVLGCKPGGWVHRLGTFTAGAGGALGPFIWTEAATYLVVPTSVFGLMLLPIAYITFLLMINQRKVLGDDRPKGFSRLIGNLLMLASTAIASAAAVYMVYQKTGWKGAAVMIGIVFVAGLVWINRSNARRSS